MAVLAPGAGASIPISVTNLGTATAQVVLTKGDGKGWFDLSGIPDNITLGPGATVKLQAPALAPRRLPVSAPLSP